MRPDNRALDQLRDVSFEAGANAYVVEHMFFVLRQLMRAYRVG